MYKFIRDYFFNLFSFLKLLAKEIKLSYNGIRIRENRVIV